MKPTLKECISINIFIEIILKKLDNDFKKRGNNEIKVYICFKLI